MKAIGIVLLILGALAFLIGFNMDTSVATTLGNRRVHNIGLMNDRQNFIIFAAVLTVIGAIFVGRSGSNKQPIFDPKNSSNHFDDTRKCPFCAESIKTEATVCRFCQKELQPSPKPVETVSTPFIVTDLMPVTPVKAGVWNYVVICVGVLLLLFVFLPQMVSGAFEGSLFGVIFWIGLIAYCLRNILRAKKSI